jgi:3-oxoacyl-[acyl-carrier-protein] synthase-3
MDLNAACSGFVYALVAAHAMAATGFDRVLVIGAETLSTITDQDDRATAVLFADGAAAVVLEAVPADGQLLGWDLGADGSAQPILHCDHGGFIKMDGKEVFRRAVRATVASAQAAMAHAKVTADEVSLFVPHQANVRIIESAAQKLGISMDDVAIVLDRTGNTSAASIPLALADAADRGRLRDGDLVLLSGFGAGMTWASAVIRWGAAR